MLTKSKMSLCLLAFAVAVGAGAAGFLSAAPVAKFRNDPDRTKQARLVNSAEQARIATVFNTRSPSAEEALAWVNSDNQTLVVVLIPEQPATAVASAAAPAE